MRPSFPAMDAPLSIVAGDYSFSQGYAALFLVIAAAGLLGSCSRADGNRVQAAASRPRVAAVPAEWKDLSRGMEIAAEFRPYQEVDVHAKVAGYLKSISVDVGDRV